MKEETKRIGKMSGFTLLGILFLWVFWLFAATETFAADNLAFLTKNSGVEVVEQKVIGTFPTPPNGLPLDKAWDIYTGKLPSFDVSKEPVPPKSEVKWGFPFSFVHTKISERYSLDNGSWAVKKLLISTEQSSHGRTTAGIILSTFSVALVLYFAGKKRDEEIFMTCRYTSAATFALLACFGPAHAFSGLTLSPWIAITFQEKISGSTIKRVAALTAIISIMTILASYLVGEYLLFLGLPGICIVASMILFLSWRTSVDQDNAAPISQ